MSIQKTLMPDSKAVREIGGKKINFREGVFWIQKQRQKHSLHYVTPYQASFAPQIPEFFIRRYSSPGDMVLDPFCGRGTAVLEANQSDRTGIGIDVSPLAIEIAKAKLRNVEIEEVKRRLKEIDFSKEKKEGFKRFEDIYHPKTYSQIVNLKEQLKVDKIDNLIRAVVLGRLHGHSPGFFSVFTFNVISPSPKSIKKQSKKHGSKPEFRDVVPRILKKAKTVLKDKVKEQKKSKIYRKDSRNLPLDRNSIDFIITSPPFLDTVNYIDDNWIRLWFLDVDIDKLRKEIVQTSDLKKYKKFVMKSMKEMNRVLKPGKNCVIEVGDVTHKSKKLNLDEVVVKLAEKSGFSVEEILINYMSSPKISKAFGKDSKDVGTQTNRCVILRKPL